MMVARILFAALLALAFPVDAGLKAVSGAGVTPGGGAAGFNDGSVVFVHPAGTLAQDANFTYSTTNQSLTVPDGTVTNPGISFANASNMGLVNGGSSNLDFVTSGVSRVRITGSTAIKFTNVLNLAWSSTGVVTGASDLSVQRDAANTWAQVNSTNAQLWRLYFSTTGPVYFQETARTAGVLMTGVGGAMQLSMAQTTVPTCSSNCGTSPSVAGTDSAGIVTMGGTGVPASGWVLTFNGTWPAAPACIVMMALTSMTVTKLPISAQATTTTLTVTTNGSAPGNSDKYAYQCVGVQ